MLQMQHACLAYISQMTELSVVHATLELLTHTLFHCSDHREASIL